MVARATLARSVPTPLATPSNYYDDDDDAVEEFVLLQMSFDKNQNDMVNI